MPRFFNYLRLSRFGIGQMLNAVIKGTFKNHFSSWVNAQTGAHLTGAETEANEFTSSEAEKERIWQENMRATNFQTQVTDMKAAGLNPALMYANGGSSSTPSGASATSVAPNAPSSLQEMLALIKLKKEMKILDSQAKNIDSQTALNKATAAKTESETSFIDLQKQYYPDLTDAKINEINAHVKLQGAQASEAYAQASFTRAAKLLKEKEALWYGYMKRLEANLLVAQESEAKARAAEADMKALVEEFRKDYMNRWHTDVPAGAWVSLISLLGTTLGSTIMSEDFWKMLKEVFAQPAPDITVNVSTGDTIALPDDKPPLTLPPQR